jgi:hypothetical protein
MAVKVVIVINQFVVVIQAIVVGYEFKISFVMHDPISLYYMH